MTDKPNDALKALDRITGYAAQSADSPLSIHADKEIVRHALERQGECDKWKELAEFHFNDAEFPLPLKAQLYLTGISALAQKFMEETNATEFKTSATLPHKASGKNYDAVFTLSTHRAAGKKE